MSTTADLFAPADLPARRLKARLSGVLLADGADFTTHPVERLMVDFEGIAGDRHHGAARQADSRVPWYPRGTLIRNVRQVSLVAPDDLVAIARRLGAAELRPEWIGANLVVEGLADFTRLPPGTRLFFPGGAALAVEGENAPCRHAGRAVGEALGREGLDLAFVEAARGRRGLVAWVERPGEIVSGAAIDVHVPAQRPWRG